MRSVLRGVLLLLLLCSAARSQDLSVAWTRLFDDPADSVSRVVETSFDQYGNLIVFGAIDMEFGVLKYDRLGELRWVKRIGYLGYGGEWPSAMAVSAAGEIFVTGSSLSSYYPLLNVDLMTVKLRANGDTAWARRLDLSIDGDDRAYAIALDSSRNVYVAGTTADANDTVTWVIIKYRDDGQEVWIRQYRQAGTGANRIRSVHTTPNGELFVAGTIRMGIAGDDIAVLKYDSSGTLVWTTEYDSPFQRSDTTVATAVDGSGNLYLAGWCQINADQTNTDLLLLKIAPDGGIAWVQTYDGPNHGEERAADLALDSNGNVIVVGATYAGAVRSFDYVTLKYSPTGQFLWSATYNGPRSLYDEPTGLAVDARGGIYVTGINQTAGNCASFGTVKYYRSGAEAWTMHFGGSNGGCHFDPRILVDNSGGVYVAGTAENDGLVRLSDIVAVKYQQLFCCSGRTGNVDWDGRGLADLSDLTLLITYLFGSPTPTMPCREEAIFDGLTDITVTDLQLLAEYLFNQGPGVLPFCP